MLKLLIINFLYFLLYIWGNFYTIFEEVLRQTRLFWAAQSRFKKLNKVNIITMSNTTTIR